MVQDVRILIVNDLPGESERIQSIIAGKLGGCEFRQVKTFAAFESVLESFQPTVIVSEFRLTRFDGLDALRTARNRFPDIPFVFLVNSIEEMNEAAYAETECWDHLPKSRLDQLGLLIHSILMQRLPENQKEVTDLTHTEQSFRENDEKFRMIMDHTNSLVSVVDSQGRYEYVSPSHEWILGYIPENLMMKSGFDFIHPDEIQGLIDILAKGEAGEIDRLYDLEYRVLDAGGNVHFLRGNFDSIRDDQGRLKNIIFVGNDITDRLESENALNTQINKFHRLVEEMPSGVMLLENEGRISYVNPKFTKITGYARDDVPTNDVWMEKAFPGEEYREQVALFWREDVDKAKTADFAPRKYTITCKDGSEKTVQFVSVILASGEELIICQDLTQQVALETQFMHAQKMESIGRMASGIAHDFNNLLTAIIGNADFAIMDLDRQDPTYEIVKEIKDAAEKAGELTRQLLAFSRKQRSSPEILDVNEKVLAARNMLQRLIGEDVKMVLQLASDRKTVRMDPGQLDQVIVNLAVNARDAMPSGGQLAIETADVAVTENDRNAPEGLAPGDYLVLSIRDTGTGIPPDIREQIFEPFFTTKRKGKGTGLGLSTVYGIIRQNSGSIQIDSQPGQGTTFKLFLPVCAVEPDAGKPEAGRPAEQKGKLHGEETILVVDDEERVRSFVKMILYRHGYTVVEAGDGQTALNLFQSHYRPIKFVLTDMMMPEMNGLELIKALREIEPDLKVLCMSGFLDDALFESLGQENVPFIAKPFKPEALLEKIRQVLDAE